MAKGGGGGVRSPIQAYNDWSRKKQVKAQLYERAKRLRPGQGIDLSMWDPLQAVAAQELIREHPQLSVVKMQDGLMLCVTQALQGALSDGLKDSMKRIGAIAEPGDVFYDE